MNKRVKNNKPQPRKQHSKSAVHRFGSNQGSFRITGRIIPWLLVSAAFVTVVLLMLFAVTSNVPRPGKTSGAFADKRQVLNIALRDTLTSLGVDPRQRAVVETRDIAEDDGLEWSVLNWRVKVPETFDLPYARRRIENAIRSNHGRHSTFFNAEDSSLPLRIEAYVEQRLSHRIFFLYDLPAKAQSVASFSTSGLINKRWNVMTESREELDRTLQRLLVGSELFETPLLISEYIDSSSGSSVFCWILNNSGAQSTGSLKSRLQAALGTDAVQPARITASRGILGGYDIFLDGILSHRIIVSDRPPAYGLNWEKSGSGSVHIVPPRVSIIIDDIGIDIQAAERLMSLNVPITLSILPHRKHSVEIAHRAYQRQYETMLHLPMEPVSFPETDPGAGRILVSQDSGSQRSQAVQAIQSIPYIRGVNNHMGSRAMGHMRTVQNVLETIREEGLYFVDSRTLGDTLGYRTAREYGIPTAERSVFIDSVERSDAEYCMARLREALELARLHGSCIAIGHPHEGTIEAIERLITEFRQQGVELVFASEIVS